MEDLPKDFELPTKDPDKTDETEAVSYITYHGNGEPVRIEIPTRCPVMDKRKGYNAPEIIDQGCSHKWKTVAMISSYATYCELCGERQ